MNKVGYGVCPCDSQKKYLSCCEPFITGKQSPETPEALMRSRYSAYTMANIDYIKETMRGNALAGFNDKPVGMCSLRENDGIRSDLKPWLGSLIVDKTHQGRGIGKLLIDATKTHAKQMGFTKLYLFAFDPTIPEYYQLHGWENIGMDTFKSHDVTVMMINL